MPLTKKKIPAIIAEIKPTAFKGAAKSVRSTVVSFGTDAAQEVISDATFNVNSPKVREFMRKFGAERITNINRHTRERVRTVLANGIDSGATTQEIADQIAHVFDVAEGSRSVTIARTEVGRSSNFGALEGYRQAAVEEKEWLATQDGVVRDTHAEADGQVVGIDEEFEVGDATCQFPGDTGDPEEDINCRCGVLPVINDKRLRASRFVLFRVFDRKRAPFEKSIRKEFKKGFRSQREAVMAAFAEAAA
jgi:SPP1 gp7 family putative phage head morphogenesis protein